MSARLTAPKIFVPLGRLFGRFLSSRRDPGGEERTDVTGAERTAAEIVGYALTGLVALALVALIVLVAAPASGCGSRRILGASSTAPTEAAPAAAESEAAVRETAPAAAAEPPPPLASAIAPRTPVEDVPAPEPSALVGDYECRFTRGERELAPVACAIRPAPDGALQIEQAGGSVRLRGTIREDEAGFRLTGEVTCTAGRCPGPGVRDILFFHQGPSAYSAVLLIRGGQFLNIDLVRKN